MKIDQVKTAFKIADVVLNKEHKINHIKFNYVENLVDENGKKTIEIGFKDAKIAGISLVEWDEKEGEAVCVNTSYVTGIEYADDFSVEYG